MLRFLGLLLERPTIYRFGILSSFRLSSNNRNAQLRNARQIASLVSNNNSAKILVAFAQELVDNWILLARKVASPKSTGPIRHGSESVLDDAEEHKRVRRPTGRKASGSGGKSDKKDKDSEELVKDVQSELQKRMVEGRPIGFSEFMDLMKKQSKVFEQHMSEPEKEDREKRKKTGKSKAEEKGKENGKKEVEADVKKEFKLLWKGQASPEFFAALFAVGIIFFLPILLLFNWASKKSTGQMRDAEVAPNLIGSQIVSWNDFIENIVPGGKVRNIRVRVIRQENGHNKMVEPNRALVEVAPGAWGMDGIVLPRYFYVNVPNVHRMEQEVRKAESAAGVPPERWINIQWIEPSKGIMLIGPVLLGLLFIFPILLFARMLKKGGFGGMKIGESISEMMGHRLRIYDPASKDGKLKIKFRDVAGLHEAKVEISEFVDYLRRPQKYTRLGAKLPKGAVLLGPPGCGKTLLAKALAAESSVPFININGTEFVEMIGGLGASRIRQLFKAAKSRSPCIIYIDEIDAIGRKRDQSGRVDNSEEEQTLNQLLVEMDGMWGHGQSVVVIGSTNRPDILDKALLRPGRFDRHISVDLPTLLERKEMFELYLRKIKKENRLTGVSHRLAQMTPGFSGADIANVVNEAAIHAATNQKRMVFMDDVDYALQKILAGPEKRSRTLVKEEREVVAFHESGHALVGWLLEHTEALLKVTIIPRTSAALGFAQYSPKDRKLFTREELFDRICMMLGGRAAENVAFGRITTGAQNDLEKVTKQAKAMVTWHGMSEVLGPLSFFPGPGVDPRSAEFQEKPYSKKLAGIIDQEVNRLVSDAYFTTEKLLKDNKAKLDTLAHALLQKETLNYEDVKQLIGPPKFGNKNVVDLADDVLPDLTKSVASS